LPLLLHLYGVSKKGKTMLVKLTKLQRRALKRVFDRGPVYPEFGDKTKPYSYKEFRRCVQPTFCMDDAVIVRWCGMWLAIEQDGYVHT
jgi:hypothetical protein